MYQDSKFRQIYIDLYMTGRERSPRGMLTKELENYHVEFWPEHQFINFQARKLNVGYIKTEFKWYLNGNKRDLSICDHAKIWQGCVKDGEIQSNYGWYLFEQQGLHSIVYELQEDPDSRRAIVNIFNQRDHLVQGAKDVPCTCTIGFRIRDGKLNMTVHMRSQDAVYGVGNELPFFNLGWELVAICLDVPRGVYHHFVESFHVYERHFKMVEEIIAGDPFVEIHRPALTNDDWPLMNGVITPKTDFGRWLLDEA